MIRVILKEEQMNLNQENSSVNQRLAEMEKYYDQLEIEANLLK